MAGFPVTIQETLQRWDMADEGRRLFAAVEELFPLCRSITGDGLRESLRRLQRQAPLELREVPTGTAIFDWTVPREWNIREAWIRNSRGETVVDFRRSSLHVVNYSVPVRQTLSLAELRPHLHSLPEHPDWIPYRTSYYKESWGFCLPHRQLEALPEDRYEVCIDSSLAPGHLTYGELLVRGRSEEEVLFSAHACHPSLANDNLAGMTVAAALARHLAQAGPLRYSYRFVWVPGTVGSIAWLAQNEARLGRIRHGLVLSCVGDPGGFTYKRSRRGAAEIDRAVERVLRSSGHPFRAVDFTPLGYDERQYCSPGIDLPVGCFLRTPNGAYPQYHTSADNLAFVRPASLAESLQQLLRVVAALEDNRRYRNLHPKGEPQLGRRGLYRSMGGTKNAAFEEALLWVLNFSDGEHALLDIAERSGLPFDQVTAAATALVQAGVLEEIR
jgi:aminopeptidase-like protein